MLHKERPRALTCNWVSHRAGMADNRRQRLVALKVARNCSIAWMCMYMQQVHCTCTLLSGAENKIA